MIEPGHRALSVGAQSLSAAGLAGEQAGSGLVLRHHLHPDAAGLPLSGGDHGLVHPQDAGLAHLKHAGHRLLRRGAE